MDLPAPGLASVVAIGVDIVDVRRFGRTLERTPGFAARVFSDREIALSGGSALRVPSLAARWAAKEAVAKALVDSRGLLWHDCEVLKGEFGEPLLSLGGTVLAAAQDRGAAKWLLSLSHDGDMAMAFVVATGPGLATGPGAAMRPEERR
jgi:holo-[acyl-carrier protein] synthase